MITVFLVVLYGIAGRMDYEEQVIYHMSEAAYSSIIEKLGHQASSTDIVEEYIENKDYYDRL